MIVVSVELQELSTRQHLNAARGWQESFVTTAAQSNLCNILGF